MKVSCKWLAEMLGLDAAEIANQVQHWAHLLTMSGTEVEAVLPLGWEITGIRTARIVEIKPASAGKNASVCLIDDGTDRVWVVCGAPNVRPNLSVLFAPIGAVIAGGVKIEKRVFGDIDSAGMILAEDELGISADHTAIIELPADTPVGQPLERIVDLRDYVLELEITPNRPDCLSHLGVARELAALGVGRLMPLAVDFPEVLSFASTEVSVEIEVPDDCPRYTARLVSEIEVKPSPLWLKLRLYRCGIRPINNVADITNYVLLETGHPLHAFDFDKVASRKILVRRAKPGETLVTLDGLTRSLDDRDLIITDGQRPIALAGIMGGLGTEVGDTTSRVLIESAYFNPVTIRFAAKALGLATESSQRFERGADPEMAPKANNRACRLLTELVGASVHKEMIDRYPKRFVPAGIALRPGRVNKILGTRCEPHLIGQILSRLQIDFIDGPVLHVTQPSHRPDLTREIDLIEEIARILGLDNVPEAYRPGGNLVKSMPVSLRVRSRMRDFLVGRGFVEILPLTLVDGRLLHDVDERITYVSLKNPLSEELSALRPDLVITMLKSLRHNLNHGNRDLKLFDIGQAYLPSGDSLPVEHERLCLGITGQERPASWKNQRCPVDLYSLKGELELVFAFLDLEQPVLKPCADAYYEDGCAFLLQAKGKTIGRMGKIAAGVARKVGFKQEAFVAEIDFEYLATQSGSQVGYNPLPRFPGSERDIAVLVRDEVPAAALMEVIRAAGGEYIEDVYPFDLFRGKGIPEGQKSVAFRICYRSLDRTLTDEEIDRVQAQIVDNLRRELGAVLRT